MIDAINQVASSAISPSHGTRTSCGRYCTRRARYEQIVARKRLRPTCGAMSRGWRWCRGCGGTYGTWHPAGRRQRSSLPRRGGRASSSWTGCWPRTELGARLVGAGLRSGTAARRSRYESRGSGSTGGAAALAATVRTRRATPREVVGELLIALARRAVAGRRAPWRGAGTLQTWRAPTPSSRCA